MTNVEIIADLLDMHEADVEELIANGESCVEMVDVVELNAALDKTREDEGEACKAIVIEEERCTREYGARDAVIYFNRAVCDIDARGNSR